MNNKQIIISIKFNSWANSSTSEERLGKEWINYRMSVFMKYTLNSLKNQTNQNFIALIQYDPQSEETIKDELKAYKKLPNNIRFVKSSEYSNTLKQLCSGFEHLYIVRLDSDDMYHKTFIDQLYKYNPKKETEVLLCQNGYIYDSTKHQITTTYRKSPPFCALVYKTEDFLNGKIIVTKNGHTGLIDLKHEILPGRNFVIVVHSKNVLTKFNVRKTINNYDGDDVETDPSKVDKILNEFM
ncbi:glycosyltransferase family A protein [Neobacillus sp. SCS-31]|uniref:glycosyltransferase family A protein n=1 Tax=Neobacillus oceani TaxID=3115292 RepID=UPI003906D2EE